MLDWENDPAVKDVLTSKLLTDFGFFARFFFKRMYGTKLIISDHHRRIIETMEAVARGEITRLIINVPPRYTKTQLAVRLFIPWGLANNPRSRYMHLSYSDGLVNDNSDAVRDVVKDDVFKTLFPECVISRKTDAKDKWYTTNNGGMYAVSTGGQITGFGAGIMGERIYTGTGSPADGFKGAIVIDDPLKPDDKDSDTVREHINSRYNDTIRSRTNSEDTPIILIMQRLHDHDMAGFLLGGGSGEKWHHLCLPAENPDGTPLWPGKHTIEQLHRIRDAAPEMYASQYMQSPKVASGNIFKDEWFKYYTDSELPAYFDKKFMSWDLTFKKTVNSDYVCGQLWGKKGANFYLLHQVHAKMTFTETLKAMVQMSIAYPDAVAKYVEEKANGDAIMDSLNQKVMGIIPVEPTESKVARAHAVTPLFQAGNVYLPKDAPWLFKYKDELTKFPNVEHDDQVDATTQALSQNMVQYSVWDSM
jgi:predicted phage terminase large subunit-like protein